jgi:hypothetical protein
MTRGFWHAADMIVRSTRLPHEHGFDAERERLAGEIASRRHLEMIAEGATPAAVSIEISSSSPRRLPSPSRS